MSGGTPLPVFGIRTKYQNPGGHAATWLRAFDGRPITYANREDAEQLAALVRQHIAPGSKDGWSEFTVAEYTGPLDLAPTPYLMVSEDAETLSYGTDTMIRVIQGWLDAHEADWKRGGDGSSVNDDQHIITLTDGTHRGMLKRWIAHLQKLDQRIRDAERRTGRV